MDCCWDSCFELELFLRFSCTLRAIVNDDLPFVKNGIFLVNFLANAHMNETGNHQKYEDLHFRYGS
jgi:hypothetical protein